MDTYAIWMLWIRIFLATLGAIGGCFLLGAIANWITGVSLIGAITFVAAAVASIFAFVSYMDRKDF